VNGWAMAGLTIAEEATPIVRMAPFADQDTCVAAAPSLAEPPKHPRRDGRLADLRQAGALR